MTRPRGPRLLDSTRLRPLPSSRRRNEIVAALGSKGSGKTTWSIKFADGRPREESLVVWDPMDEWPARLAGRRVESSPSPLRWIRERKIARGSVAVRFGAAPPDEADILAAIAWCRPPCLLVFEEVQRLCSGGRAPAWLMETIATARHRAVSLLFTSQRPALVPKDIIANADRVVAFRLGYADDRAALHRSLGDERLLNTADLPVGSHLDIGAKPRGTEPRQHREGRRHRRRNLVDPRHDGPLGEGPSVK